ncbi:MAG: universal stress protein [Methanobrevibacter sp.]|uniref:universal stress protein n=1 Tax=Methanobrevibacter sp. TaxID=66852 RepID=UPI002E79EF32|nr:universal stress protein [Methanobrevibacter sp.]MEE0942228.1 universal stress protein [Methanobrevibacter sp.]
MYKKILLPTDGSAYADEEIERAIKLLADDGEIIVLSVAGKLTSSAFQSRSNVKKINKGLRAEAEDSVNHMVKKFPDDVKVTPMVKVGFPAEVINDVAEKENVDLIIISASGKSGIHRFFIGSVAEKVLKTTEIDTLLIHNK